MLHDLMNETTGGSTGATGVAPENYSFFTGDIDDFQNEFSAPKQDMGIGQEPDPFDEEELMQPSAEEKRQVADSARKTAQFITSVGDTMLASSLAWLDHSGDPEPHKRIDDPLMADLENAITYYCERVGGEIPPSVMIVICVLMLYGVQIPQALRDRKEWERQHAPTPPAPAAPSTTYAHDDTPKQPDHEQPSNTDEQPATE